MKSIQIDNEVYAYLASKARPYEETTPNMTLRRLFGLEQTSATVISREVQTPTTIQQSSMAMGRKRGRARNNPKVSIPTLINEGLVKRGQVLYLYDYRRKKIPNYEATLADWGLIWNGTHYSMSDLAKRFLQKEGYQSDSVRGPMHWGTADGVTIKDMWEKHRGRNGTH
jgi:hypothetical protein